MVRGEAVVSVDEEKRAGSRKWWAIEYANARRAGSTVSIHDNLCSGRPRIEKTINSMRSPISEIIPPQFALLRCIDAVWAPMPYGKGIRPVSPGSVLPAEQANDLPVRYVNEGGFDGV